MRMHVNQRNVSELPVHIVNLRHIIDGIHDIIKISHAFTTHFGQGNGDLVVMGGCRG